MPDYSNDDQFLIFLSILEDYNIVRKFRAIIADNTSPNNVFYRLRKNHWRKELDLIWKAAE
jgi:hypothetical protein